MELETLINVQLNERYKNFLIHGPALSGKTELARRICEKYQCKYISLLELLINNKEAKDNIDIFGPSRLIQYIKDITENDKLMVVDQIDFLINTWTDSEVRDFMVFIDKNQSESCYIFVMQTHKLLEKEELISLSDKGTHRMFNVVNLRGDIND
ncbi:hypothetical protein CLHOM_30360 [Clostridium homopropionicum DSM 5847]|uniref:ATPase AAA-type core domain-containing protein n=1 Tax=Clostridium homopropionicum DSM 5847 TaxID=1121318 RepID=A0A0L6Z715_9CLOT|nr:AAA family ATPase [Clostridium homopropionicum]KOA18752.1 hypothetical protein CLHOM_30360 [Clostridium homopropionicum DSM 5847]SFG54824.1 AAA domain-containing protein [Clostridium homopropionicum]